MIESLPPLQRLALAYAPAATREPWLALLALDARLAAIVRSSREPMLAQLRLAWWREQLGGSGGAAAVGDPLLEALQEWPGSKAVLAKLADGWEAMTGSAPLPASAFAALAESRGRAFAALADTDSSRAALRMGRNWALADIAAHLSDPGERKAALALAREQNWRQERLPRGLRVLAVLHGLAARTVFRDNPVAVLTPGAAFAAIRIGLLGR
jgi:phytoene synthase